MTDWREGLTYKDWLMDGSPIRGEYAIAKFLRLDWSKAWVDIGPSVAGNLGPYWHVPMDDGDTTHRLYPKVLQTKWLLLIRQACEEYANLQVKRSQPQPQYLANCQLKGACRWECETPGCTNLDKVIVVRRCVEPKQDGIVYPGVET